MKRRHVLFASACLVATASFASASGGNGSPFAECIKKRSAQIAAQKHVHRMEALRSRTMQRQRAQSGFALAMKEDKAAARSAFQRDMEALADRLAALPGNHFEKSGPAGSIRQKQAQRQSAHRSKLAEIERRARKRLREEYSLAESSYLRQLLVANMRYLFQWLSRRDHCTPDPLQGRNPGIGGTRG